MQAKYVRRDEQSERLGETEKIMGKRAITTIIMHYEILVQVFQISILLIRTYI
jgi:hypothetical protein